MRVRKYGSAVSGTLIATVVVGIHTALLSNASAGRWSVGPSKNAPMYGMSVRSGKLGIHHRPTRTLVA